MPLCRMKSHWQTAQRMSNGALSKSEQIKKEEKAYEKNILYGTQRSTSGRERAAYAAEESLFTKTPHTFTAKVGTTEFTKDGVAQPLDVPMYIKDGYVMLPLRTFMQALDADAELVWEDGIQLAKVTMQDYTLSFDITGNRIWRNSSLLPSFGQMEVKDGRVFVPLRDWRACCRAIAAISSMRMLFAGMQKQKPQPYS